MAHKRKQQLLFTWIVLMVLTWGFPAAWACIHAPKHYKGSIAETSQEAVIFHQNGREELILKVAYKVEGDGPGPNQLGWVIPVPNQPDKYAVAERALFKELFDLTKPVPRGGFQKFKAPTDTKSIVLLEKTSVGEYTIQPILASGRHAGTALNGWLQKNGFGTLPDENLHYYLENQWTFLAIRIDPAKAGDTLKTTGTFRPLRISFLSDRIVYPLKFSSHQGSFPVNLYVITPRGLPRSGTSPDLADALNRQLKLFGFTTGSIPYQVSSQEKRRGNPSALSALWQELLQEGRIFMTDGVLDHLYACCINESRNPLTGWKEDFSLAPPK